MSEDLRKQETERLSAAFVERIFRENETLSLETLTQKDYPHIFLAYLSLQAKLLFERDCPLHLSPHSRYPYRNEEIQENIVRLKKVIVNETVFTKDELTDFTAAAFQIKIDMLIAPRTTLVNFIYGKRNKVSKIHIMPVIDGLDGRRRLVQELLSWLKTDPKEEFTQKQFEKAAASVEAGLFSDTPISAFLSEINAYLAFESKVMGNVITDVHYNVLEAMLYEREMAEIVDAFASDAEMNMKRSVAEIENRIGRYLLVGNLEDFSKDAVKPKHAIERDIKKRFKDQLANMQFSFLDEDYPVNTTEIDNYEDVELDDSFYVEDFINEDEPDIDDVEEIEDNFLATREEEREEEISPQRTEQELELIEKLFGENENNFDNFIEKIKKITSWDHAKEEINKEISSMKISPYTKEALLLGDVVFEKFFSTD